MENKTLNIDKISKRYTDKVGYSINLLKEISFTVNSGEFTSVLAPVGSGKSSFLKILSNLDKPTSGKIDSQFNKIIYIPSEPSSFPWLNVLDNISFNSKYDSKKIEEIVNLVELHGYEDHFPNNKSEGFRFRISLARAFANDPDLIIIDEPFNSLNTATRKEIYQLVRKVSSKTKVSFLLGTTNITEAIFLSDKVFLMKKNPGELIDEIKIDLPTERTNKIIDDESFINLRTRIENIFKERTDRQLYNFSI